MKINPFEIKRLVKEAGPLDLSALNYRHSRDKSKPGRQGSYTGRYSPQGIARQRGLDNLKKFRESNPDIGYDDLNDAQRRQLDNLGMQGGGSQDVMGLWDSLQPESAESLAQRTQERADAQFPPVGTPERREADRKRLLGQTSINSLDELNNPGASATRDMAHDKLNRMRTEDEVTAGPDMFSESEMAKAEAEAAAPKPGSPEGWAAHEAEQQQSLRDELQKKHYAENPWQDPEYEGLSSASDSALLRPYLSGELDPATAEQFEQYGGVSDLAKRKYEYDRYNTVVQDNPNAPRGYLGGRHSYEFNQQYGPGDYAAAPSAPRPAVGSHASQDTGAQQPAPQQPAPRMAGQHHQGQTYDQVMQTARSRGLQLSPDGKSWISTQAPAGAPPPTQPVATPPTAPQPTAPRPQAVAQNDPFAHLNNQGQQPGGMSTNPYSTTGPQTGPSSIRPTTLPGVKTTPSPGSNGATASLGRPVSLDPGATKQPTNAPPIFKGQVFQ